MAEDLTDAFADLKKRVVLLEDLLDRMVQGVMLVGKDHVVEVCNRRAIDLLGLPPELVARRPMFNEILEFQWSTDEFAATPEEIKRFVRAGGILDQPQCYERVRPNGSVIEVQSVPLDGGGVLRTYTDITEKRRDSERIRHQARHDGLTALLNKAAFVELLTESINLAITKDLKFAVHYVDLDGFKPINDSLGHQTGDQVLAMVAERMRSVAREQDFVARIGGDEFAILQLDVHHAGQAAALGQRLQEALASPITLGDASTLIGASCGIALFPDHGVSAEQLLRCADLALYEVKAAGGHGARIYGQSGDGPSATVDAHVAPGRRSFDPVSTKASASGHDAA